MEISKKDTAERLKKFEAVIKTVKKNLPDSCYYKDGAGYMPGVLRTGLPSIDMALRIGGIPRKRIIELYGPEHSGKTSLSLHVIAEVQKQGGNVVYLDAENSLDPEWAEKLGVDINRMVLIQQTDAHSVLDQVRLLVQSGVCDMFVVDSVAALTTKAELDGDMGDHHPGEQARLMKDLMKVINIDLLKTQTIALFTNQIRNRIGIRFGNPETTTGGNAFRHYASIRIEVKKASDEEAYKSGHHVAKVRIAKNKLGPPFGIGSFRIDPLRGILPAYSIIEPAVELGVIKRDSGGKKYEYNGKTWTFESRMINALETDPILCKEIIEAIYKKFEETKIAEPKGSVVPEDMDLPDETEENPSENPEE